MSSKETKPIYEKMLQALQNLGNAETLAQSPLISSCIVNQYIQEHSRVSAAEALRAVLTELLTLLEIGSKTYAALLHTRFWDGKTLKEIRESAEHNPLDLSMRTIQDNQRTGIYKLAAWFQEKEKTCQQIALDRDHKQRSEESTSSKLVKDVATFVHKQPTFSTKITENFQRDSMRKTPKSWKEYGGADIMPTILQIDVEGQAHQVLNFPQLPNQRVNKDLISKEVKLFPPYQVKTQLTFQNEPADRAGIIIGWQNRSRHIRIQANLYWNHISYWEHVTAAVTYRHTIPIPEVIEQDEPYWLSVQTGFTNNDRRFLVVSWGTDEQNLTPIMVIEHIHHPLTGYVGLSTSGPNLPHIHFHALHINY